MMDIGEAFHSPFIVPVAGCALVLGIVISSKMAEVRKRQMEYQERMSAIAKGLPLPPLESEAKYAGLEQLYAGQASPEMVKIAMMKQARLRSGIRRGGIVSIAVAVGLALFFITLSWILQVREVLAGAATALIPFAVGVGLLIDAHLSRRDEELAASDAPVAAR